MGEKPLHAQREDLKEKDASAFQGAGPHAGVVLPAEGLVGMNEAPPGILTVPVPALVGVAGNTAIGASPNAGEVAVPERMTKEKAHAILARLKRNDPTPEEARERIFTQNARYARNAMKAGVSAHMLGVPENETIFGADDDLQSQAFVWQLGMHDASANSLRAAFMGDNESIADAVNAHRKGDKSLVVYDFDTFVNRYADQLANAGTEASLVMQTLDRIRACSRSTLVAWQGKQWDKLMDMAPGLPAVSDFLRGLKAKVRLE